MILRAALIAAALVLLAIATGGAGRFLCKYDREGWLNRWLEARGHTACYRME